MVEVPSVGSASFPTIFYFTLDYDNLAPRVAKEPWTGIFLTGDPLLNLSKSEIVILENKGTHYERVGIIFMEDSARYRFSQSLLAQDAAKANGRRSASEIHRNLIEAHWLVFDNAIRALFRTRQHLRGRIVTVEA